MTSREHELDLLREELENKEAGVADLMKLYEKVEGIYVQASASMSDSEVVYTMDSTSTVRVDAYLGRDSSRTQ